MKKLLILALLLGSMALLANPMPLNFLSEFWFDNEGDMFIELSRNFGQQIQDEYLRFGDGTNLLELPQPISVPQEPSAVYFNLSQALPALNLNSSGGQLTVEYRYDDSHYVLVGYATWNWINSPTNGRSLVVVYDRQGGGWDDNYVWTIETPPTPGTDPYYTNARAAVNITCSDQNDNPVPNARVYVMSRFSGSGYTDAAGFFSTNCICHPITIRVLHPQTNELVYYEVHNFYPGATENITVDMTITANDDPTLPAASLKGLEAFPNPFIPRNHEMISLRFDGDQKVLSGAEVIVYNLKGQEVAVIPMHSGEENNWIPAKDLPSGIYLLKLIKNHKNYGSQTIRILK